MSEIKLIVTDLDGTLLRTEKSISPRTAGVLSRCQSKGVKVAFATARSKQSSRRFLEQFSPDVFIGHGGALTLMGDRPAGREAVPADTAARLIRRSLNTPEVRAVFVIREDTALCSDPKLSEDPEYTHYRYADLLDLRPESYLKVSFLCGSSDAAQSIAAEFPDCRMQGYSGEDLYSFTSAAATKWNAVQALAAQAGVDTESFAAFGDDWNDLELLQNCRYGVAMGNAIPEVQAAARFCTASNDEDGVAKWLEEHVLR